MKRSCVMMLALVLLLSMPVYAADRICGEVFYTDIKAYVDGRPIRSYNIDGWTGVVAEDLRNYGFTVTWMEAERELYVYKDTFSNPEITASYQFEENTHPVGAHAGYVYQTDIKTYVAGNEVRAFNIGGWTLILIDELQVYGDVIWEAAKREIGYTYRAPWTMNLTPEGANSAKHEGFGPYADGIRSVSGRFCKQADGSFVAEGTNLDHLSWVILGYEKRYGGLRLGFSMIAHHLLADGDFSQLCWDISTMRYDGERLKENADLANQHVKISINGKPVPIKEVTQGKGNNHQDYYFVLDLDIKQAHVQEIAFTCSL